MQRTRDFRFHHKERVINKRKKEAKSFNITKLIAEPNRLAKRHPLDCGVPDCHLCRGDSKEMTRAKKKARKDVVQDQDDDTDGGEVIRDEERLARAKVPSEPPSKRNPSARKKRRRIPLPV